MKIARIHSVITSHPIREERVVVSAAGRHSESTFLIVAVEDENGLTGYGEAATTLLWSGESAQTAQWIVDSLFAPKLVGATIDHPREALAIMDVARLRAVREALGDEPVFTIDYNGAFQDADAAAKHIESLLPYRLALVEQPTHRDRIHLMADVKKRVAIPILADESIFTPDHLAEAIDLDAFDILSVYPGKNGGFTRSIDMVRTAAKAGKPCVIGSNLETDLGQAAMATLAAGLSAFPIPRLSNDFASAMYYMKSSTTPPLRFEKGELHVPAGIGFGVTPLGLES